MLKRVAAVLWAIAVLAGILTGCFGGTEPEGPSTSPSEVERGPGEPPPEQPPEPEPEEKRPIYAEYDWPVGAPEDHGVNGAVLDSLHAVLPKEMRSILTVKDGVIIDEYYGEEYDEDSVFPLASVSKSVTGALIGIAIDEGLIEGVDVSIAEYFPAVAGTDKEGITIRHLLEHTSGLAWDEWDGGSAFGVLRSAENWVDHVLAQDMAAAPGTVFNYNTGGSHLLSAILQQATGMTAFAYGEERLFAPMGMANAAWGGDPQGITAGGNGIELTARDAAKFGQLFLNSGQWEGWQLLPAAWVEESTRVQVARSGRSGSYGYQWWVREFSGYDTYYAMGHGGQYIFVAPELALVTVITSRYDDTYAPWPYFTDYVLAACGP